MVNKRLLKESQWILLLVVVLLLTLSMIGHDGRDAAWSHSGQTSEIYNPTGAVGAYLSDLIFSGFGFSAWWLVVFLLRRLAIGRGREAEQSTSINTRHGLVPALGISLLIMSSAALESMRLYTAFSDMPLGAGGLFGAMLGKQISTSMGFTGGTLLLIALMAIGMSFSLRFSWLSAIDIVGEKLEKLYRFAYQLWVTRKDKKQGQIASIERANKLEKEFKKQEERIPILIEPQVIEVAPSQRANDERQVPLFANMPDSELPPLHLLDQPSTEIETISPEVLEFTSRLIEKKLADFGVEVKVVAAYPGPVITRYEIDPAVGVKGSQIVNLIKDLARALSVVSIRVVETIPGKSYMALELPNPKRQIVALSEILGSQAYADMHSHLTMAMGKDISGKAVVADLGKMPHVLVAGTTGSGKSVAINAMILSLLYKATPQQVRLILIDPKMLELSVYEGIPHLLAPVVTDMRQAASALNWAVQEMDKRYKLMSAMGVRNIGGYNQKIREAIKEEKPLTNPFTLTPEDPEALEELPFIVVFIDELADLMMVVGKKIEELIARLAQKARAAGIHLVLATQRPSVDVITGLIKANVPTRVAFQVSSKIDSRTILDQMGAEALLGMGDMLYLPPGSGLPQRVHGAFVSDQEVHRVTEYLKAQGMPNYIDGILSSLEDQEGGAEVGDAGDGEADALYDQAVEIVVKSRRASISLVQRHLRIGYNRAARLVEQMERAGIVSPMQSNGNREVIAPDRGE